jgi:ATP-dependent protease HslVU (ClpYQ) peptidase subunit
MTCIVGLVHDGKVFMGGDSAATINNTVQVSCDPKVFLKGEFLFGYSGDHRFGSILRFAFTPPAIAEDEELDCYMAVEFVNELRKALRQCGYLTINNSVESSESRMLVGLRGHLFYVDPIFATHRARDGFNAIGCAEEAALAVMHATKEMPAAERVELALVIASRLVEGVRPPFTILSA